MAKRKLSKEEISNSEPLIDPTYERRVNGLHKVEGKVTDYEWKSEQPDMSNKQNTYLPATTSKTSVRRMSEQESALLGDIAQASIQQQPTVIQLPSIEGSHTGHTRQVDSAMTNAKASAFYSLVIIAVIALVVGALLILATFRYGVNIDFISGIGLEICITGIVGLGVLYFNRGQGLHHSSTGIAHAENKTRERSLNRYAQVEEHRIDADKEVRLAQEETRRMAIRELAKRLESGE